MILEHQRSGVVGKKKLSTCMMYCDVIGMGYTSLSCGHKSTVVENMYHIHSGGVPLNSREMECK